MTRELLLFSRIHVLPVSATRNSNGRVCPETCGGIASDISCRERLPLFSTMPGKRLLEISQDKECVFCIICEALLCSATHDDIQCLP